jgi:hypothetical protein
MARGTMKMSVVMIAIRRVLGADWVVRAKFQALHCACQQFPDAMSHAAEPAERTLATGCRRIYQQSIPIRLPSTTRIDTFFQG